MILESSNSKKRKQSPEPKKSPRPEKQIKLSNKFNKTLTLSEEFVSTSTIIQQFQDAKQLQILTQLFYTIGNSLAIRQFKDICQNLSNTTTSLFQSKDIGEVVQALDNLDTKVHELEVLRKYQLFRLTQLRDSTYQELDTTNNPEDFHSQTTLIRLTQAQSQ